MTVTEFIEKYGKNIPEGATVCDPSHKPELFFVAPARAFVEAALYRDRTIERGFVSHGDTVYFPKGYVLELNEDRAYLPLWEIYETINLRADGNPLPIRYYQIEEVFPDNYDGDAATIQFKKTYVEESK